MVGKIFLLPSFLNEDNPSIIPQHVKDVAESLDEFIVENAKTARRFLRSIGFKKNFDTEVTMHEMDKHGTAISYDNLLKNVLAGKNCGIVSEAGNPCIADPGNEIVAYAHKRNIEVVPLVGPSSILLALIASGFNGQQFTFNGYLPIQSLERIKKIRQLENTARSGVTQIFMETPFRNQSLLEELLKTCGSDTLLSVACDLTLPTQFIRTKKIADWKVQVPDVKKRYCIFLLGRF